MLLTSSPRTKPKQLKELMLVASEVTRADINRDLREIGHK